MGIGSDAYHWTNEDCQQSPRFIADNGATQSFSLFYLPAINAGHLEFVRDIVADTIQRNIDAATMSTKNTTKAQNSLAAGNTAFANKQSKTAYDSYVSAYQAAVQ